MIRPNMATMLGYIATDAKVAGNVLQDLVRDAANKSFNRITIDGDTSTNDCCMLIATGQAALPEITSAAGELFGKLKQAVLEVFMEVAQAIVRDGEERPSSSPCRSTGRQSSGMPGRRLRRGPFAADQDRAVRVRPELGRILAAVGYAGVPDLDVSKIDVFLGEVCIASQGGRSPSYTEEQGAAVMAREEISIRIELGRGSCSETI